jgi:hypothetical protein
LLPTTDQGHGLHETFTNVQFPPNSFCWLATLIRLYEFLKNSRGISQCLSIDQYQSTPKPPDPGRFGIE